MEENEEVLILTWLPQIVLVNKFMLRRSIRV